MATEFKLSYTGAEIEAKLKKIESNAEAIENKVDKSEIATDEEVLMMLSELDVITPIVNSNNEVYTSNDGKVYSL